MSGAKIGDWGKFEKNLFKGISGIPDEKVDKLKKSENDGVLSSRVSDVKSGHIHASSVHLNLSFDGDDEFGELHAAIRLLLPLIPAIAASSPYLDSKYTGFKDARIEVYRHNQDKVPEIAGLVIPEKAYTYDEYNTQIFDKVKKAIAPYDPEHLLNHFFLNSRGAIARFDRGAIEIRLVDIQECPNADIAIVEMEVATLKAIANGRLFKPAAGCAPVTAKTYREMLRDFDTARLSEMLTQTSRDAENTIIDWPEFLAVFGMSGKCTAGELWKHVFDIVKGDLTEVSESTLEKMLARGTLSSALYCALGDTPSREDFVREYGKLANCLAHNRLYGLN